MLAQRLLVDLELLGDIGLGDANGRSLSTSARCSAVGSYSAGISRSVSLNQRTRAREAGN
jgi:hypothetical protein